jgi:hypothetical protein
MEEPHIYELISKGSLLNLPTSTNITLETGGYLFKGKLKLTNL